MNGPDPKTAQRIDAVRSRLASTLTERHYARRPELEQRYGPRGRAKCREDTEFHLRHLAEALALGVPELFSQYLGWAARTLQSRGIPVDDLRHDMAELQQLLCEEFPDSAASVAMVVAAATAAAQAAEPAQGGEIPDTARRYLDAALKEGPLQASGVVDALVASGRSVAEIYADVLQPALEEVGRLWQRNELSVAEEHYCAAVTQRVLARLYSDSAAGRARGPLAVVACVQGELHDLGPRMVCDLLALDGFKTHYLGADMPTAAMVDYCWMHEARVLAISASITPHLAQVRSAISRVRADRRCKDLKIVVGGRAFNGVEGLWRIVGADAWAPDAKSAVAEIRRAVS